MSVQPLLTEPGKALHDSFSPSRSNEPRLSAPRRYKGHPASPFWGFIEPLIRRSFIRWHGEASRLLEAHPQAPLSPGDLLELGLESLPRALLDMPLRTLVLELNVARLQGQLSGQTPSERFASFLDRLGEPDGSLALLQEYPVLAHQLMEHAERWRRTSLELLERLCRDWPALSHHFPGLAPTARLRSIQSGAGDTHRGGRSVAVLTFDSGSRLVYKPRPLTVDLHFQQLLQTVNGWMGEAWFRPLELLDQGGYGWSEFVPATPCSSMEEVHRFYQRQGGYLALLYLLRATDIHFENLIAAGEHPILVDLETLFHPRVERNGPAEGDFIEDSVLHTALLPIRLWSNDQSPGVDMSGLGMREGQLTPRADPYWADAGTDQMRLARRYREVSVKNTHRPMLNGQAISPLEHVEELVTGFTRVYETLSAHRDELSAEEGLLARFAKDETRVLLRATMVYNLMLQESFHPDFLRDAVSRDRFFDKLWAQASEFRGLDRLVRSEQQQLQQGDIPFFSTTPCSRDVWSASGEHFPGFFSESAFEVVTRRLRQFGKQDLDRQVWFIRASLSLLAAGGLAQEEAAVGVSRDRAASIQVSPERLLKSAMAVGDRLSDWAMQDGEQASWMGLVPDRHRCQRIAPLDGSLYEGQAGVILFLAYLGQLTGVTRYTELARKGSHTLLDRLEQERSVSDGIGAFVGLGGVLYVLGHLAVLWEKSSLLEEAHQRTGLISDRLAGDGQLDWMSGAAGCIASLAALYRLRPSDRVLRVMVQAGEHLLERVHPTPQGPAWMTTHEAPVPLTGLSHGVAGIAAALLELAALSGERRFHDVAMASLAYERSLFSPEHGNWPDVRVNKARFERFNWCHGAPGIGLARLRCLPYTADPLVREEIAASVEATLSYGFGRSHCLCHGDLGNLELLQVAQERLPSLGLQAKLEQQTALTLERMERSGWRCGVPMGVETPGLMTGLSGIGYGLLRLAAPRDVPSVLLLEPPRNR